MCGMVMNFKPEKLVIGLLISEKIGIQSILKKLESIFGRLDFISEGIPFLFSDYYSKEMGINILRYFVSFEKLRDPSTLAGIKIETNGIEEYFSIGGKRRVNIDPGFMALSRFVLASTKESSHRIPLSGGIYGEITLMFEKKTFRPVEWTYPDFRSSAYIAILNRIRDIYKKQIATFSLNR